MQRPELGKTVAGGLPASWSGRSLAVELQEGDVVPFQGSARAEEGRGVEFGVGRISPAMVSMAVF